MRQSQDAVAHLVDVWLNKYFRAMYPENLKNIFKGLSDKQIAALATGKSWASYLILPQNLQSGIRI